MKRIVLIVSGLLVATGIAGADSQPIEIGTVDWGRDLPAALAKSGDSGKPVLLLFQEVPGCSGCKKFGKGVLSHPLLKEAVETEFEPVVVYNNQPGKDAETLKSFKEPAWNYQVIRFLGSDGKDLIPRKDKVWKLGAVARRMEEALVAAKRPVPAYLSGLGKEFDNPNLKDATFSMFCFWTGELRLGGIEGVVKTEAGFYQGEVTRVWYDSSEITLTDLVKKAASFQCANRVLVQTEEELRAVKAQNTKLKLGRFVEASYRKAPASDQKKQIQGTPFLRDDMTAYQLTKVNATARKDKTVAQGYLSPRQKKANKK